MTPKSAYAYHTVLHQETGAQAAPGAGKLASGKIARARELKDEGNLAFKAGEYRGALKKYHHALMYTKGVSSQGSLSVLPGLEEALGRVASKEEKKAANEIALVVFNNMSGVCVLYVFGSIR